MKRMKLAIAAVHSVCIFHTAAVPAAQFTSPAANYSVTCPDGWNAEVDGRAIVLRNFPADQTPEGGTVPPDGAIVIVQVFPPYDNAYFPQGRDDYSALDYLARNSTIVARTNPSSGQPARMTYIVDGLNLREVWTVRHSGERVFLLSLTCAARDSRAAAYEEVFDSVVASISMASATPGMTIPAPSTRSTADRAGHP